MGVKPSVPETTHIHTPEEHNGIDQESQLRLFGLVICGFSLVKIISFADQVTLSKNVKCDLQVHLATSNANTNIITIEMQIQCSELRWTLAAEYFSFSKTTFF